MAVRAPRPWLRRVAKLAIGCGVIVFVAWIGLHFVPLPAPLMADQIADLQFQDRAGRPLRIVRPGDDPFHKPVDFREIPLPLIEATLAAEDGRFWNHHGVDLRAMTRAAWQFVRSGRVISGGSTISQQLIKLSEPPGRPRTLRVKLVEAVQALRLEQVWSKQRILAAYLNRLDYGGFNRGCAAAAESYFGKPLRDLDPAECALLAGLPQSPARLNPRSHPDRAIKRERWILGRMRLAGSLPEVGFRAALAEPLRFSDPRRTFEAPHVVDLLLSIGAPQLAEAERGSSGHRSPADSSVIQTTIDLDLNRFAENVLRNHLGQLHEQHVSNGAVVVLDNRSGDVLALVGSTDYFAPEAGEVNAAWAPRSTGSALKPFTYWLALERGATPATIVADIPVEFATDTGLFAPVNYNRRCYGPMRYRIALANSLNISAVKVLASLGGPAPLKELLENCGITTLTRPAGDYGLGMTIGTSETRLLELANAYACLARLGEFKPYRLLTGTPVGKVRRVGDSSTAYLIADILSDNDARTLAFGPESALRFDFPVACKTGTSSDFRDNWAFGYTPEFTVGVWVGNDDNSPMRHISGVTGAAPVLHDMFEHLHDACGTTWYSEPADVVQCWIHPITGKRLTKIGPLDGAEAVREKFIVSRLPPVESARDYASADAVGEIPASRIARLGDEYRDWFASADNWLAGRAVLAEPTGSPHLLFPPPGTILYLDPDLPDHGRKLDLRASGPVRMEWRSDSLRLIRQGDRQIALLTEGHHEISVSDPVTGEQSRTWIEVRVR